MLQSLRASIAETERKRLNTKQIENLSFFKKKENEEKNDEKEKEKKNEEARLLHSFARGGEALLEREREREIEEPDSCSCSS